MKSFLKSSGNLLLLIGFLALAWSAMILLRAHFYQKWALSYLNQSAQLATEIQRPVMPPASDGALIGRIDIPRIGVTAIVLEGANAAILRRAVGHISGTALPGQPGNVAIAGHRDTFFRPLRDIRTNDEIALTTPDGSYHYRVESTRVVEPDETVVLQASLEPILTLVTCYPFYFVGPASQRFIVRASRLADGGTLPPAALKSHWRIYESKQNRAWNSSLWNAFGFLHHPGGGTR
ncbi:MAG: class D sortase [Acidobacteria bacterium]|nr:class D sortase [Acidobacteriota bacterium]